MKKSKKIIISLATYALISSLAMFLLPEKETLIGLWYGKGIVDSLVIFYSALLLLEKLLPIIVKDSIKESISDRSEMEECN